MMFLIALTGGSTCAGMTVYGYQAVVFLEPKRENFTGGVRLVRNIQLLIMSVSYYCCITLVRPSTSQKYEKFCIKGDYFCFMGALDKEMEKHTLQNHCATPDYFRD